MLALLLLSALAPGAAAQSNVLVLVADDLGVDRVGAYAEHPSPGRTPTIDGLAQRGVLFRNAWANPVCTPSRAGMLTGRHAFRHGLGTVIQPGSAAALPLGEVLIPEMLDAGAPADWTSVAIGKWHLGGLLHPLLNGFDLHAGSVANLAPGTYFLWEKSLNGSLATSTQYATSAAATDAARVLADLPEPWFCWLAFNAPHKPYHAPPDELHTFDLTGDTPDDSPVKYMKAVTEAMDTEIGRLLGSLPEGLVARTTIVFVGDNGTDRDATSPPFKKSHSKGTVYEGGVNVPLIVTGPAVRHPGSECGALVHANDLFATVAELAGVDLAATLPAGRTLDSVSLLPYLRDPFHPPLRSHVYTEQFKPLGSGPLTSNEQALRGERYKLVRIYSIAQGPSGPVGGDTDELYDLLADPFEATNLLDAGATPPEALAAYAELVQTLDRLHASEP